MTLRNVQETYEKRLLPLARNFTAVKQQTGSTAATAAVWLWSDSRIKSRGVLIHLLAMELSGPVVQESTSGTIPPGRQDDHASCTIEPSTIVFVLFIFGTIGIVIFSIVVEPKQRAVIACNTSSCRRASSMLRRSFQSGAAACSDFYQFVCGEKATPDDEAFDTNYSMVLRNTITAHPNVSQNPVLQKTARLYHACVDVRRRRIQDVSSLLYFLKQKRLDLTSDVDPLSAALSLDLRYGIKTLFDLSVIRGLLVVQKRKGLDTWSSDRSRMIANDTYDAYVRNVFEVLNVHDLSLLDTSVKSVLKTEDLVLSLYAGIKDEDGSQKVYLINATDSSVLRRPEWKMFVQKHFERLVLPGTSMLSYLESLFAQATSASLTLYIIWEVLRQIGPFVDHRLIRADEAFGVTDERCFHAIMAVAKIPALASVLARDVTQKSVASAKLLYVAVVKSLSVSANASWLRRIPVTIAGPRGILASRSLKEIFSDMGSARTSFATAYLRALAAVRQKDLDKLDGIKDDATATVEELVGCDVVYDVKDDAVTVPTALLRPPVFVTEGPQAVNFGGLGRLILRVLVENVLKDRIKENGNLTSCIRRVAGKDLTADMLTDTVHLDALYRAFSSASGNTLLLEGLATHRQEALFFIAFCQPWCRVDNATSLACNLPVMNSVGFAHAFACPVGSPMSPGFGCSGKRTALSLLPH